MCCATTSITLTSRWAVSTQTIVLDRIHSNVTFGVSCYFSSRLSISSTPGSVSAPSCCLEHGELHLTSDLHNRGRVRRHLEKAGTTHVLLQSKLLFTTPNRLGNQRQSHVCPSLNTQAASPSCASPTSQLSFWNCCRSTGQKSLQTRHPAAPSPPV